MTTQKESAGCSNATVCSSCRWGLTGAKAFYLWYWVGSQLPCGNECLDELIGWCVCVPLFIVGFFGCYGSLFILNDYLSGVKVVNAAEIEVPSGLDPVRYREGWQAEAIKVSTEGLIKLSGTTPGTLPYVSFVKGLQAARAANKSKGK